jgi:N-acetyl-alpha-D-muramate 1-phosphate uridylyltransferase
MITHGMVLAAGLGTRMRPLTQTKPKPLVQVAGTTLLDHALDTLAAGGIGHAVVNVHYLPAQVEAHLAGRAHPAITISDERDLLLETGGGVAKALPLLAGDSFVVMNADNLWFPGAQTVLAPLLAAWNPAEMDTLLLLVSTDAAPGYDGAGDFFLAADGRLVRRGDAPSAPFAYAGIHITARAQFEGLVLAPFSLNRLWNASLATGRLFGLVHPGRWFHVGDPQAVDLANAALL